MLVTLVRCPHAARYLRMGIPLCGICARTHFKMVIPA
jgi:hypothetical protein